MKKETDLEFTPGSGRTKEATGVMELADELNAMLRDCEPVLRNELFFEQNDDTAQLMWRENRISESLSVTKLDHPGPGFMLFKPYTVDRASVVRGVRYTKNGDGWPDDVDVTELGSFETASAAFDFLIVEWFREQIARCREGAAELRMMENAP